MTVGAVIIGRNEGARLERCLASLDAQVTPVVYVDSGSTDGSLAAARAAGAQVVELDTDRAFTAARARNAGLAALAAHPNPPELVQFIDGDCALRTGWLDTARHFLQGRPDVAVVCGRRRERHPEASVYNWLTDCEWDTPVGAARACGGDAVMRRAAVEDVGRYNPEMIAGEEPELCVRLRKAGWTIWRLDAEMTWHDADMHRFSQWWTRCMRAGHAFAEGAALHGARPERHNMAQTGRALLWGGGLPVALLAGLLITPWAVLLALVWPLRLLRMWARGMPLRRAAFLTLGSFPEALGILSYCTKRLTGRKSELIEYK